ncbi:MAG: hypothetical protein HY901_12495 [Deltaproteobacteria bacterium]|nr:hypothetical protein [Deltaproteobacteria bacterium]
MGPIPNDSWGRGKLRVFRAHTGAGAPANEAPVAAGRVTRTGAAEVNVAIDAQASSDPESGALRCRWDLDDNGTFDLGPLSTAATGAVLPQPTQAWVKLEVADPQGRTAQALLPIEVLVPPDAGPEPVALDAGSELGADGATATDGPPPSPVPETQEEGCGCGSSGSSSSLLGCLLLTFAAAGMRRRRSGVR